MDAEHPDYVCQLAKSLYGLKQAPRAWFQRISAWLHNIGFNPSDSDSSLFVFWRGDAIVYLLVYVDDIILTVSTDDLLHHFIKLLKSSFALKDLGPLRFFLGVQVQHDDSCFFLT